MNKSDKHITISDLINQQHDLIKKIERINNYQETNNYKIHSNRERKRLYYWMQILSIESEIELIQQSINIQDRNVVCLN